jgi:hypothetical protein
MSQTPEYQAHIRTLFEKYKYRLDTNYAKIDRIVHPEIETFKTKVLNSTMQGLSIGNWSKILSSGDDTILGTHFEKYLSIK